MNSLYIYYINFTSSCASFRWNDTSFWSDSWKAFKKILECPGALRDHNLAILPEILPGVFRKPSESCSINSSNYLWCRPSDTWGLPLSFGNSSMNSFNSNNSCGYFLLGSFKKYIQGFFQKFVKIKKSPGISMRTPSRILQNILLRTYFEIFLLL